MSLRLDFFKNPWLDKCASVIRRMIFSKELMDNIKLVESIFFLPSNHDTIHTSLFLVLIVILVAHNISVTENWHILCQTLYLLYVIPVSKFCVALLARSTVNLQ